MVKPILHSSCGSSGSQAVSEGDSVTRWLDGVKAGDGADIQRLWDRYFKRLVRLAGAKLPGHRRRAFDEEDVAISAFHSFCDRAGRGQFPRLDDRDDLWRLLATLTVRKAALTIRHQTRKKRGGGLVLGESALVGANNTDAAGGGEGLGAFLSREPSPEDAARFTDEYDHLLGKLEDPTLKAVALGKLDGRTSDEIAAKLGVTTRTVDRKLKLIRAIWEAAAAVEAEE
jgi:DNA-directed RNA polymerase specialized sigma24 family protein